MPTKVYLLFTLVFIIYSIASVVSYNDEIRNSYRLFVYGLPLSFFGSVIWYIIIRILNEKDKIYVAGIYWDVVVAFTCTLVPLLFFNLKLNYLTWVGVGVIFLGLLLIKISNY